MNPNQATAKGSYGAVTLQHISKKGPLTIVNGVAMYEAQRTQSLSNQAAVC